MDINRLYVKDLVLVLQLDHLLALPRLVLLDLLCYLAPNHARQSFPVALPLSCCHKLALQSFVEPSVRQVLPNVSITFKRVASVALLRLLRPADRYEVVFEFVLDELFVV